MTSDGALRTGLSSLFVCLLLLLLLLQYCYSQSSLADGDCEIPSCCKLLQLYCFVSTQVVTVSNRTLLQQRLYLYLTVTGWI